MEYRAISLHQPWASLVALGIKRYETRSWSTKFRGKLLICSAKKEYKPQKQISSVFIFNEYDVTRLETYLDRTEKICDLAGIKPFIKKRLQCSNDLPLGKVLCVVDLVDCLKIGTNVFRNDKDSFYLNDKLTEVSELELLCGEWQAGRYAWELGNVMTLPKPIPIKGKQGLWTPDSSIIQDIEKQFQ